jgi:hypothetical protein
MRHLIDRPLSPIILLHEGSDHPFASKAIGASLKEAGGGGTGRSGGLWDLGAFGHDDCSRVIDQGASRPMLSEAFETRFPPSGNVLGPGMAVVGNVLHRFSIKARIAWGGADREFTLTTEVPRPCCCGVIQPSIYLTGPSNRSPWLFCGYSFIGRCCIGSTSCGLLLSKLPHLPSH